MRKFSNRAKLLLGLCTPYLGRGGTILDFGTGTGEVAAALRHALHVKVRGVDVVDYVKTDIPVTVYDGTRLPFNDKAFDSSLAIFSLHHCEDPESALRELIRVTRRRLIVVEDTWTSPIGKLWLCALDYLLNRVHTSQVPLPFNFRTLNGWIQLFQDSGLAIRATKPFTSGYPFLRHVLFVVDIATRAAPRSSQSNTRGHLQTIAA